MARIDDNEKLLLEVIRRIDLKISILINKLKIKNGRLVSDSIALREAIKIRKEIAKQFGPYYTAAATATNYAPVQKEVGKILKDAGISSKFTKTDASFVKAFSDDGLNQLTALGNQYSADISKRIYVAVASGDSLEDLTLEVRQLLLGGTDKGGRPMVNHAQTIATTGYQEVDSILLKTKTDHIPDDEIEWKYAGSLIKDSRKWCQDHVGKTFTRAEIAAWEDREWKGKKKGGDPFTTRGGWNCRHRWLPKLIKK